MSYLGHDCFPVPVSTVILASGNAVDQMVTTYSAGMRANSLSLAYLSSLGKNGRVGIRRLFLQNFRNYSQKTLEFSSETTLIIGPNASGKTNILEAVYALATGKSFRADNEREVIRESREPDIAGYPEVTRVMGETESVQLEIIWDQRDRFQKWYKVDGIGKRQTDFIGHLRAVLFCPQDIEIVTDSPSVRRQYLDLVLTQVFKDYRLASRLYEKALRARNKLLWRIREENIDRYQLEYWNNLLIVNGGIIHERRKEYLAFLNGQRDLEVHYDQSVISASRLAKYAHEEIAAGTTLVGPHRDDFQVKIKGKNAKNFGSRGEQRLAVFNIKLGELEFIKRTTGQDPVLLLDDIFSELDDRNRQTVLEVIPKQQTIMTATEFRQGKKEGIQDFLIIKM